jgi:hypothetical protein
LAHSFRGFNTQWTVPLLLNLWQGKNVCCRKAQQKKAAHFTAARKQRAREEESDNKIYALKT